MKTIFYTIITILAFKNAHAQTPIKALGVDVKNISNAYYKDMNNELDEYVGTWKYSSGSTSLTIVFQKKIMQFILGENIGLPNTYEDILIGEYRYVENGIEKANTLSQLSVQQTVGNYSINGNALIYPGSIFCHDCGANDQKVMLSFIDAANYDTEYWTRMFLQRVDSGGVQKLKIKLQGQGPLVSDENAVPFTGFIIPEGTYILQKQP